MLLDDARQADALKARLQATLPDTLEVLTYRDVVPLLVMQRDLYAEMMYLIYLIIGVALIFGIINAMLMAVLERLPEFGVLRAIGMSEGRLFLLVSLESLLLGLLGTAIGWALSLPVYAYLARHGLDLAVFSEALAAFGVGSVIYPRLTLRVVWNAWLIIPLVAWLGALYPAWRAIHVEPVEAMRAV
ncbi:ABC transporter permease [Rhodothermus marinus]|uniref:ABC transporter permease n=1 Tax=Rhodothermus marinus TaxID=29549 RepID=UPI000B02674C|nr:FtsX-like permease family protein [Rhodothermus marinus]